MMVLMDIFFGKGCDLSVLFGLGFDFFIVKLYRNEAAVPRGRMTQYDVAIRF